jgi:tetratricopeptide (TPR) repeat protein
MLQSELGYALEYQQKALKHRDSTADKKGLARGLKNLAVITYSKDNDSEKALKILNEAMELAKKGKDPQLVINIAIDRSKMLSKLELYDEAMKDFVIVRRFSKKYSIKLPNEHEKNFSDLLLNLGFLKYDQGKFEDALKYLKNAALILKTKNDPIAEKVISTIQKIELKLNEK